MSLEYEHQVEDEWVELTDYPGYLINKKGEIWSDKRKRLLTPYESGKYKHLQYTLSKNGKSVQRYLSKLLAETFIPNPENYPLVRHLNDNPRDNNLTNLAWGTYADNRADCIRNGHAYFHVWTEEEDKRIKEAAYEKTRKPIKATKISTGETYTFISMSEASRKLGINVQNISSVVNGKRKRAEGHYFELIEEGGLCD